MKKILLTAQLMFFTFFSTDMFSMNLGTDSLRTLTNTDTLLSDMDIFPITVYDKDIGFGYGLKLFFLNQINFAESMDATVFHSTLGERWYRFVISLPDYEFKLQRVVPFYGQLIFDYDKWISSNYFGIGPSSSVDNKKSYTKEPFELQLLFGYNHLNRYSIESGVKYKSVRISNIEKSEKLKSMTTEGVSQAVSLFANFTFETRDSYINPSRGYSLKAELEKPFTGVVDFLRCNFSILSFKKIDFLGSVFANKIQINYLDGNSIPFPFLSALGGNNTLRGFQQDRFIDRSSILLNSELRFPVYWNFGAVIGIDYGQVFNKIKEIKFRSLSWNSCLGLRYFLNTFIVRFDIGFSKDYTGIYFNFNHIF